jgi:hypothetical protein
MRGCLLLVLFLIAGLASAAVPPRQMALTIDDLPSQEMALSTDADLAARNARIIAALKGTNAIGF